MNWKSCTENQNHGFWLSSLLLTNYGTLGKILNPSRVLPLNRGNDTCTACLTGLMRGVTETANVKGLYNAMLMARTSVLEAG